VGHLVQPPCRSRVTQSRLHRTASRRVLNISREGESPTSLGSLFQCSVTLKVKKFFVKFSWNFQVYVCPVLRAPELDTGLPGGVSPEWSRGAESPPRPAAHTAGDAAQGTVGLQGCQCTLPAHAELLMSQHDQVLVRAALNPIIVLKRGCSSSECSC